MLIPKSPSPVEFNEGVIITNGETRVRIITGTVAPPSDQLPAGPNGSLYLYVGEDESAIYQYGAGQWTRVLGISGGAGPSDPDWAVYPPAQRPVFSVTSVNASHWLRFATPQNGYYFTLHKAATIEFRGVSGSITVADSATDITGETTEDGETGPSTQFPALYSLSPGYYRIRPGRWGSLTIRLHAHSGTIIESWPATSWAHTTAHTNTVFTWHSGPEDPWL